MSTDIGRWMFCRVLRCAILFAVLSTQCWPQRGALPEACQLSGHCFGIIHKLAEPIVTRSAEGDVRISSTLPDDPMRGATVEVFGPGDSKEKHSTKTDAHGHFKIKGLPPGHYSFHVWASGFNSVVGDLTISKRSVKRNKLHIEMTFGV
jgi:hypothetical protein